MKLCLILHHLRTIYILWIMLKLPKPYGATSLTANSGWTSIRLYSVLASGSIIIYTHSEYFINYQVPPTLEHNRGVSIVTETLTDTEGEFYAYLIGYKKICRVSITSTWLEALHYHNYIYINKCKFILLQ